MPSTPAAFVVGMLVGTLGGMLIGALIVRLRGIYFALATIAFGQVFYFIAFRWNSVTGGDNGLRGFHRLDIDLGFMKLDITSSLAFYYVALAILALCAYAMRSEEHTSELQSLMRISYAVFFLTQQNKIIYI